MSAIAALGILHAQQITPYLLTVSDVKIVPAPDNDTPRVNHDVYYVSFLATIHNTTRKPIFVSDGIGISMDRQSATGAWIPAPTGVQVSAGAQKGVKCTRIEPRKTFGFPKLTGMIVFHKSEKQKATSWVGTRVHHRPHTD